MRILIVDDSKAMRRIIQRSLRQAGFGGHDITEAADGQAALQALSAEPADLVLSDWNMPEMNGIELLRAVREQGNEVPFGFITTEGKAEMRTTAIEAGANFLLEKPFTPEDMEEALSSYID